MPSTAQRTPEHTYDVVVVGGGITGLTLAFRLDEEGVDVAVAESGSVPGGTARTTHEGGWHCDWGPNGFLTNVPDTLALARACGLEDALVCAGAAAKRRYLWRNGQLVQLPTSPPAFATSGLLGVGAKFRVLREPFAPERDPDIDETVYEFAQRRLGTEFAENFIRPMVVGITAGDAREVSLDAMFPRMRAMEVEYGSLFKALRSKQREAKAQGRVSDGPGGPSGRLTTFLNGGVERLCQTLAEHLRNRVSTSSPIRRIERCGDQWLAHSDSRKFRARKLVLAVPAHVAATLVEDHDRQMAQSMRGIPYSSVRVLGLGYSNEDIQRDLDGFGFLVPPGQPSRMLGCLWTSSIFPHQAPEGHALLRIIAGGVFDPDFVNLTDDQALEIVHNELAEILGISALPVFVHHAQWPKAIPQYLRGHLDRVEDIERRAQAMGIDVIGNAYRGVSLNDCVHQATALAQRLTAK